MFLPGESFSDGDSKVFTCDHHLKYVAMETVCCVDDFPASRGGPDDSALSEVELNNSDYVLRFLILTFNYVCM